VVIVAVFAVIAGGWFLTKGEEEESLVVYCAHDSVYADAVLNDFQEKTGIKVHKVYDTEATKSLGLIQKLIKEKSAPRCDVFWNNELLGTMDLQEEGVLEPYKGTGYERIPDEFKDPDGYWTGFGSRLRVYIVNTDNMEATEQAVDERLAAESLKGVCLAKPLYGTTLTHFTILWDRMGGEQLKAWHDERLERGLQVVDGNAQVKDLVSAGKCDMGYTDTDDFYLAVDEGKPVAAVPVRLETGSTICIPNTVSVIKGTDNPEAAHKLVDYLLSADCELRLANSKSRQVPLGDVDETKLPEEVNMLKGWAADGAPLHDLLPARSEVIDWLKAEGAM
jgi:iron(III) transport system substrate-binding protein